MDNLDEEFACEWAPAMTNIVSLSLGQAVGAHIIATYGELETRRMGDEVSLEYIQNMVNMATLNNTEDIQAYITAAGRAAVEVINAEIRPWIYRMEAMRHGKGGDDPSAGSHHQQEGDGPGEESC